MLELLTTDYLFGLRFVTPKLQIKEVIKMQTLINSMPLICFIAVIFITVTFGIYSFITWPTEDKKQALKEWLKWAVTMAEIDLGSGTGQLKLRQVYGMAVDKFPWLIKCLSFEEFSAYVDEALIWMREQLAQNKSIAALTK